MAVGVSHPYYPRDLVLPHYVPNDKSLLEILGVFFGIVAVFLVGTWLYTGSVKYLKNSALDRLKICWFVSCALIHTILEGHFSLQHQTLAGDQAFLSQMCKSGFKDHHHHKKKEKKIKYQTVAIQFFVYEFLFLSAFICRHKMSAKV